MIFLNHTIALLFIIMILGKFGLIDKIITANIFNGIYKHFTTQQIYYQQIQPQYENDNDNDESDIKTYNKTDDESDKSNKSDNEFEEIKQVEQVEQYEVSYSNIINYKYNPTTHYERYLNKISNSSNSYKNISVPIPDTVLTELKLSLGNFTKPTVKDVNKCIAEIEYKYTKELKDIIVYLGYKIPIITEEQKKQLVTYFTANKIKFSRCRTGCAPFLHFYDICVKSIEELNLSIDMELVKEENTVDEDYLSTKKNQ